MATDPIVQQVRQIRHEIERECRYDPEKYYQVLMNCQQKLVGRLVRRQPRLLATVKTMKTG